MGGIEGHEVQVRARAHLTRAALTKRHNGHIAGHSPAQTLCLSQGDRGEPGYTSVG